MQKFDVAIVGGGIVGLANAWMASRKGLGVALFERERIASGASVRNFGMVWPIGQPSQLVGTAMKSREYWLELKDKAGVWINPCGSVHLAYHDDEQAVLEEFVQREGDDRNATLLTSAEIADRSPAANPTGLRAGMLSQHELCVNPLTAIPKISRWLSSSNKVDFFSRTTITGIVEGCLSTSAGEKFHAERIVICSGSDFETLFPASFQNAGLMKCKLQMLATRPQPSLWKLGPHLAGGLTLRHYKAFNDCPSHAKLRQRVADSSPLLDKYGIHVMASQNDCGEVILGDSHVYDDEITPFDSDEIDTLILDELKKLIQLPDFEVARRWHGVYAKHLTDHVFIEEPIADCKIMTATGGAGMTLSFGLAEQVWDQW